MSSFISSQYFFLLLLFSQTFSFNYSRPAYVLSVLFLFYFPTLSINLTFFSLLYSSVFFFSSSVVPQFFPSIFSFIIFFLLYSNYIPCLHFRFLSLNLLLLPFLIFYFFSVFSSFFRSFLFISLKTIFYQFHYYPYLFLGLFFLTLLLLSSFFLSPFFYFFFPQSFFITRLAQGTGNSGSCPGRHHTALSCVWDLTNKK